MEYFDALETRTPEAREHDLMSAVREQVTHAIGYAPALANLYADIDPAAIISRENLAGLPVLRKNELFERQQVALPFGGFVGQWRGRVPRIFSSPGPIYELEGCTGDYWRAARALFAAGFRAGELVHNAFSYHMTPGAWAVDAGARALGCTVFPGGVGQSEQQVRAMADLQPEAYCGTPSFLKILLEKACEMKVDVSSLTKAMVTGEPFPPKERDALAGLGVVAYQSYATAELGIIAYETVARDGLVVDEGVILEIVRPGTGDPVPAGEVGEVVVTTFNREYPLIRFGTGDLSAILPGISPCGRTNMRIKGWMGRADQTIKVRGMFVTPKQISEVVKRHMEIIRARLVVDNVNGLDSMTLHCEARESTALADAVVASLRDVTKLRGEVIFHAVGDLPNDGKIIHDART